MADVLMPKLAEHMESAFIVDWLAVDGDELSAGDDLLEVETDKATTVLTSEHAGTLAIVAAAGTTVTAGDLLATVGSASSGAARAEPPSPRVARAKAPARDPGGPVGGERHRASPVARRLAREHGIDLAAMRGSGRRGRIHRRDVEAAVAGHGAGSRESSSVKTPVAERTPDTNASEPKAWLAVDVDMAEVVALRAELGSRAGDDRPLPSLDDFIVMACARALRLHPGFNGDRRVNVGIAVATPGALVVPTLFDADQLSLSEIARRARRLADAARDGTLEPRDLEGCTFTVANLGMYGIHRFGAILGGARSATLAVGAVRDVVVPHEGEPAIRPVLTATLLGDQRILHGADGARFLSDVRGGLERPLTLAL